MNMIKVNAFKSINGKTIVDPHIINLDYLEEITLNKPQDNSGPYACYRVTGDKYSFFVLVEDMQPIWDAVGMKL